MEVSDVRKRVKATLERAKQAAADRRAAADEAASEYQVFLDRVAIPIFRQLANILRAEKHPFSINTPGGSVRPISDRSGGDYVELVLETEGSRPHVLVRANRGRGRRVIESETALSPEGRIRDLTEEDVLAAVLKELEPMVER